MQLNKNQRSSVALAEEDIIISFLCAFATPVVSLVERWRDNICANIQGYNLSIFSKSPVLQKNLFMGSKPNFLNPRITTTTCKRGTYNDLHLQNHNKSKPNPNPISDAKPIIYSLLSTLYTEGLSTVHLSLLNSLGPKARPQFRLRQLYFKNFAMGGYF